MTEAIFWAAASLILYTYFGYPVLLAILVAFKKNQIRKESIQPRVTIVIAAYNEERRIGEKIENTLSLHYPREKKEIIITSDGSTDDTNQLISEYLERGVRLLLLPEHRGKEFAQREAIKKANGEILVFSDVATMLKDDAISTIVMNFHNPAVGCVSSEDIALPNDKHPSGEGIYIKYEMFLRRLESKVYSLVGLSGSFFAIRRELCNEWRIDLPSDFALAIHSVKRGYRAVSDRHAVGHYKAVISNSEEFRRKVRTGTRAIAVLMQHFDILNPFRYGFFSIQIMSHKVFRYLMPLFLLFVFVTSIPLAHVHNFYTGILLAQLAFYFIGLLGFFSQGLNPISIFKIPVFFTVANLSIAVAWLKYFSGHRSVHWDPSRR